jgi:hypothetical protein
VALNENLDVDRIDVTVRRAFLRRPEKLLLKPPIRLYRWANGPLPRPDGNRPLPGRLGISPWWSFVESTRLPGGALADGFRVSEERARRIGRTHREFARARAAISGQFDNTMTDLIVVQLVREAWGLGGQASGQPEFAKERADLQHVFLIGGAYQLWIPNLTTTDVQAITVMA